jgi:hypothetical protein
VEVVEHLKSMAMIKRREKYEENAREDIQAKREQPQE